MAFNKIKNLKRIKCVDCEHNNNCENGQQSPPSNKGCHGYTMYDPTDDVRTMFDTEMMSEEEIGEQS